MKKKRKANKRKNAGLLSAEMVTLMENLPLRHKEVIRPVLEQPRSYVLLSLRSLARRLGADPATLLRLIRSMGFERYHEFQRYLHELAVAHTTSLDIMEGPARVEGLAGRIRQSLDHDIQNLRSLRHSLDTSRIASIARKLYEARRIVILAGDMATSLALFLEYNLAVLGLNVVAATGAGQVVHRVRQLRKRDVVIAISYRRGLRQTVDGVKQAKANGVYCVGISDSFLSPVARHADEFFPTPTEGPVFSGSYTAPMAFLNMILVGCANLRRRRNLALLREVAKEQQFGFRWYYVDSTR